MTRMTQMILPLALAAALWLTAAPPPVRADAPPAPAPDVPIPEAEMPGVKVYAFTLQRAAAGETFGAKLRNQSRYTLTSVTLEAHLIMGDGTDVPQTFTLTGGADGPLPMPPLRTRPLHSPPFPAPTGTPEGVALILKSARGVPVPPDTRWPPQQQLLEAAAVGDLATLRALLATHVELINTPAPPDAPADAPPAARTPWLRRYGGTPLHLAALGDHLEAARLLLDRGAHVNARDAAGRTPLYMAVAAADIPLVTLLLARHADANLASEKGPPLAMVGRVQSRGGEDPIYREIGRLLTAAGARPAPPAP